MLQHLCLVCTGALPQHIADDYHFELLQGVTYISDEKMASLSERPVPCTTWGWAVQAFTFPSGLPFSKGFLSFTALLLKTCNNLSRNLVKILYGSLSVARNSPRLSGPGRVLSV